MYFIIASLKKTRMKEYIQRAREEEKGKRIAVRMLRMIEKAENVVIVKWQLSF